MTKLRSPRQKLAKNLRAVIRDTALLVREFQWPLVIFIAIILLGGALYHQLSLFSDRVVGFSASVYHVLGLVFLQPSLEFPEIWYLQLFYFLMPILGIGILAQGVADFGVLFFNRKKRSKEWEMAVASTYKDHVLLVGLGHLGYRVVRYLAQLNLDVVVIEIKPDIELIEQVRSAGITVIEGDALRESVLKAAGIPSASAIVLCMQNDGINLQIALKAKSLNPQINVIIRIFDDDFADELGSQFGFQAMSSTSMAAPAFAAAAASVDMTRPITLDGMLLSLAQLEINLHGDLENRNIREIETTYSVSVVLLKHAGVPNYHPDAAIRLHSQDTIVILGGPDEITRVLRSNRSVRK
jgi:Trk K+ transport system NAD-binding subunit